MTLAWLAFACSPVARLEQLGIESCPDPAERAEVAFDLEQMPQVTLDDALLHGGAMLVADLDLDGWLDVFAPGEFEHVLRWARPDAPGHLYDDDLPSLAGLPLDMAVGATAVDVDGDYDLDILVTRWQRPLTLLRNDGERRFVDVSAEAFPTASATTGQSASWADIDADGDLDLFVGTYAPAVVTIDVTDPAPDCSDHDPDPAQLWRNDGDGTFTDISDTLPDAVHGYTFMSGFYDLEDDGYPELFLAHDDGLCGPSVLLWNDRGTFRIDETSGFDRGAHDMGMGVGDLNGDELPDFLLSSWNGADLVISRRSGRQIRWIESADAFGLALDSPPRGRPGSAGRGQQVFGWGAQLADLDNDLDLDALIGFGYWAWYDGAGDPRLQHDGAWIQGADGQYSDQAHELGLAEGGWTRSVLTADLNGDGYLDVIKHILNGGIHRHLSRCGKDAWLRIRLFDGTRPNTWGVGARIAIDAGSQRLVRWIESGSSGMYSGGPLEAHFGLGSHETVDRITVHWPDGATSMFHDVPTNQQLRVDRDSSLVQPL